MLRKNLEIITSNDVSPAAFPYDEDRFGTLRKWPSGTSPLVPPLGNEDYVWTTVRDPAERVLSGYAETVLRWPKGQEKPWSSKSGDPTGVFASFLEALGNTSCLSTTRDGTGKMPVPCTDQVFHAWPMAILIDVAPLRNRRRYDAMARVENLEEDLRHVLTLAGATKIDLAMLVQDHHSHAKDDNTQIETANPRVMRAFCRLYEVDYTCFPAYAPPKACVDVYPEFISSHPLGVK